MAGFASYKQSRKYEIVLLLKVTFLYSRFSHQNKGFVFYLFRQKKSVNENVSPLIIISSREQHSAPLTLTWWFSNRQEPEISGQHLAMWRRLTALQLF